MIAREIYGGEIYLQIEIYTFSDRKRLARFKNVLSRGSTSFTLARKIRSESAGGVGRRVDNAQARDSKFYKIIPSYTRAAYSFFRRGLPLDERRGRKRRKRKRRVARHCPVRAAYICMSFWWTRWSCLDEFEAFCPLFLPAARPFLSRINRTDPERKEEK